MMNTRTCLFGLDVGMKALKINESGSLLDLVIALGIV